MWKKGKQNIKKINTNVYGETDFFFSILKRNNFSASFEFYWFLSK